MTSPAEPARAVQRFGRPGPRAWVRVDAAATDAVVRVNGVEIGRHRGAWTPFELEATHALRDGENELVVEARDVVHATNGFLPRIGMRWCGVRGVRVLAEPTPPRAPARQRSSIDGTRLLVDGKPLRVRGILHWGYYPELGRPWPDDAAIRAEIAALRDRGFNLIKMCLWVPPERYLDLCDELGMLVWQEYPVWDAPLDDPALVAEFDEMFALDAPHPCVVLRSLTCENDRVEPKLGAQLVARCRERIPGALVIDNSGWLCAERGGDFHDEHAYLHNLQWRHYATRVRDKLTKPLLLGETMCFDEPGSLAANESCAALAIRRFQIETLGRDLPDAGYVVTGLRDIPGAPLGIFTADGTPKHDASAWAWHGETLAAPRALPPLASRAAVIGPRKHEWKCREHTFWSPVVRVLARDLPADALELVHREAFFDLFSGRVLTHTDGARVLVELVDHHDRPGGPTTHALAIELRSNGEHRVVHAFRTDTQAGRAVDAALRARAGAELTGVELAEGPPPELGALEGDALVLERWTLQLPGEPPRTIFADTPLVNAGANVFEGRATLTTRFPHPGGRVVLVCESIADFFELRLDGAHVAEAGPREGTWDGTRDRPRQYGLDLAPGEHELVFHVRDWRGGGAMVGPVYLTRDPDLRVF